MAAYTNKGPYKKPRRDIAKREIRRLIIDEGLTNNQISERLNIPQRSVERYINELYRFDNEVIAGVNGGAAAVEHAFSMWNICKERMNNYRNEILTTVARNPEAPFRDKMAAWNIICELDAAILRMEDYAPEMIARRTALAKNSSLLLNKEGSTSSSIVNLKLLNRGEKEENDDEEEQSEEEDEETKRAEERKIRAKRAVYDRDDGE
jgi:hypothetical protein